MGKNMGKGGKAFKKGKSGGSEFSSKRELIAKEEGEEYARVKSALGNCKMLLILPSGDTIIGNIPGRLQKNRALIAPGHTVLISRRDFQSDIVDIVHLFNEDEVKMLIRDGDMPSDFRTADERVDTAGEGFRFVKTEASAVAGIGAAAAGNGAVVESDPLAGMVDDEDGLPPQPLLLNSNRYNKSLAAAAEEEETEDADLDDI